LDGCGTVFELSPPAQPGGSWTETVLYSFPDAEHGYLPRGDLVFDTVGNLYGATEFGGGSGSGATCDAFYAYCGAIFELSPPQQPGGAWTEQVLHGFAGAEAYDTSDDGSNPTGGLVLDGSGNLYGTTYLGGFVGGECSIDRGLGRGCGTVFELHRPTGGTGDWKEEILYEFTEAEGTGPMAGVTFGKDGNLYGSISGGGSGGEGVIFELFRPTGHHVVWTDIILHDFNSNDGPIGPEGPVTFDSRGNLYGTSFEGNDGLLRGTVFQMPPPQDQLGKWGFKLVHVFPGIPDGENPAAPLVWDKAGNLYSTTVYGGSGSGCSFTGCGTVFELSSEQ
jgi:hypothetical protein